MKPLVFPWSVGYAELYELCRDYHCGQWSAMYSISSTGTIHDADTLRGLESELGSILRSLQRGHEDAKKITKWLAWVEKQTTLLPDED